MAEYIKREDAMSHPFANGKYDKRNANLDFILGHESYKEWLENIPAADVRENVRGEWIKQSIFWTCSECEKDIRATTDGIDNFDEDPVFCPYCGADMRGE